MILEKKSMEELKEPTETLKILQGELTLEWKLLTTVEMLDKWVKEKGFEKNIPLNEVGSRKVPKSYKE